MLQKEGDSNLPITDNLKIIAGAIFDNVPQQDQRFVAQSIAATAARTPDEQRSYLSKLVGVFGRTVESIGAAAESGLSSFSSGMVEAAMADQGYPKDIQEGVKANNTSLRRRYLMVNSLRKLVEEGAPIEAEGWAAEAGLGAARSAPFTLATFVPVAGLASMGAYFRDDVSTTLLEQNPGMRVEDADMLGLIASPLMGGIEFVSDRLPLGHIPFVGAALKKGMTSWKSTLIRGLGMRIGLGTVGEIGEEVVQQRIPLYLQELSSAMSKDMAGVDWHARNKEPARLPGQVLGPALLLNIVGGGGSSIADLRGGRRLALDADLLIATGASPALATEIQGFAQKGDWRQVDALLAQPHGQSTKRFLLGQYIRTGNPKLADLIKQQLFEPPALTEARHGHGGTAQVPRSRRL